MRHQLFRFGVFALPFALCACGPDHLHSTPPPPPKDGTCATTGPKLPIETLERKSTKFYKTGPHLVWLDHEGTFDIEVVGGGGGGGGARAAKESVGGGSGGKAEFTRIVQRQPLDRDYYLIDVGAGGDRGRGGWNFREFSLSDGGAGGDTRVLRCSSGALIAISHGGVGGNGHGSGAADGATGESFINTDTKVKLGDGGRGGRGAQHGEDGGDATGYGAGGGGQGATDTQNDGKSHGGRGANGYTKITIIGESK